MKKRISAILAVMMCFSLLTACRGSTPTPAPVPTPDASKEPAVSSTTVTWPTAPLQVIASGPAGGSIDTGARMLAQYLEKEIDQAIVINADASIPQVTAAYEAAPDGNSVLFTMGHFLIFNALGSIPFGLEDMQPCAIISEDVTFGLWVNANSPYNTLEDLVSAMKEKPGEISVGMLTSSYIHLASAAMLEAMGCEALLVDVGGDAARVTALVGNQVDACIIPFAPAKPYAESGDLRCLAIMNEQGKEVLPDAKTFVDLGYDFDFPTNHSAIYFPKGTDMKIVEEANAKIISALNNPEYQSKLAGNGCKPVLLDVAGTTAFLEDANEAFQAIAGAIK